MGLPSTLPEYRCEECCCFAPGASRCIAEPDSRYSCGSTAFGAAMTRDEAAMFSMRGCALAQWPCAYGRGGPFHSSREEHVMYIGGGLLFVILIIILLILLL